MHGSAPASAPVSVDSFGGLVTLADPSSVPAGASPRNYDRDYLVGSTIMRSGLTNAYSMVDAEAGPNAPTAASSATWLNPNNILVDDGAYASQTPVNVANFLDIDTFVFNVPSTSAITGILLTLKGYTDSACDIQAQLLVAGLPVGIPKLISLPAVAGAVTLGSNSDLWGTFLTPDQANSLQFGVRLTAIGTDFPLSTAFLGYAELTIGVATGNANFQFVSTFVAQNGDVKNVSLDANGNFWVENLTQAPGTLTLAIEGITPNSLVTAINGPDVEYLAFTDGKVGSDLPLQYGAEWTDRITQVGPGAAPVFTPIQASGDTFAISTITQPTLADHFFIYFLQSSGVGSSSPGNIVTIYYADSTLEGPNQDLVDAFNSGNAVYLYVTVLGTPTTFGPQVVQVTSVGLASPPGQPRQFYYFTFALTNVAYTYYRGSGHAGYEVQFQRSLATMTMVDPVPGLEVGNQVTITGNSVSGYNNQWNISQALDSGAMEITATSVTSGVATFTYALQSGTAPTNGQLVTITGTTNANGSLNMANASIESATGGSTGSFSILVPSVSDFATVSENAQAVTAGTIFCFDPGMGLLGTSTSPIYGTGTGGTLVFAGPAGQFISPGTKQGTVFFITRNGMFTMPAFPVTFTVPENTTGILASQIPIGPPNVIKRGIAFTESGSGGTPGANFFCIPDPVTYIVNDVSYTANSTFINDNTSTSARLFFTDIVLLNALAIDVYGYNLFNCIEIGDPQWLNRYADRMAFGGCLNKVQEFNNLSFDGGYLPSTQPAPLGWSQPDIYGRLVASAKFGDAYYIKNTSGGPLTVAGLITQSAFQDGYLQPIIQTNTTYSVRVSCRIPSGMTGGTLNVRLTAGGVVYGSFAVPFSEMTTSYAFYSGTLLTQKFTSQVPSALQLEYYASDLEDGADIEIDRIDPYPTEIPNLGTTAYFSYAGLPEQVDAVTGKVVFESENQQPVNGGMVLYDTFYALKGWTGNAPGSSLYSLQKASNLEPADWDEPEVAQRSGGAIGPLAFDLGEQWFLGAARSGLYLFEGGQPGKIMQEIFQVWDAINWNYGYKIWVRVDLVHRRIFVGVPLPTPNFWLPNAPVNANPTSPNVILMCNYQGLDSGSALKEGEQMHTTMFGTLNSIDMRRKWSIWQIPSPYANLVQGPTDEAIYICNGIGSSKIYKLDEDADTDDGAIIDTLYTTAGLVESGKRAQQPQLGIGRLRWDFLIAQLQSLGNIGITLYPNVLLGPASSIPVNLRIDTIAVSYVTIPPGINVVRVIVNFQDQPPAIVADQSYQFSGATFYPTINGKTLVPYSVANNSVTFYTAHLFPTDWPTQVATPDNGSGAVYIGPVPMTRTTIPGYNKWTVPGGVSPGLPALEDCNIPLNFAGYRAFFEFRENDGRGFSLSNMILKAKADPWNKTSGRKA